MLSKFQPAAGAKGKIGAEGKRRFFVAKNVDHCAVCDFSNADHCIPVIARKSLFKTSDLGLTREAIVMLPVPISDKTKMNTLRARLAELTGVEKATLCYEAPASSANSLTSVRFDNHIKDEPWR